MTSRFYDDVVRPVDRLWFANDACDQRGRRWIEGAIAAAVKNAYAIHAGHAQRAAGGVRHRHLAPQTVGSRFGSLAALEPARRRASPVPSRSR